MPEKTAQKEPGKKPAPSKKPKPQQEVVVQIPLSELHPFPDHPFQVREDASMQETAESVKEYGVLVPALARPREDGGYELIAGHRRKHACELAGLATMPVIVRDIDRDAATIIMVDSNLQRENILPSERAKAYKMKMEAIKRQGARTDLTSPKISAKFRSDDEVGQDAGVSGDTIRNYIALTQLVPELQQMVDEKKIALSPAYQIAALTPKEQGLLLETIDSEQATPSLSQAQRMKKLSQSGELNEDTMLSIMTEQKKPEKNDITLSGEKLRKYFPRSYTPYVFDVSDTSGGENSRRPYLWEYRQEHREVVSAALEQRFDVSGENGLADQMERVAAQLVDEYWHDNRHDIVGIVDGSFLEDYDEFNIGAAFRNAAVVSTTYTLLSRCGMQPGDYFEHEDFLNVFDFNTPQTVAALGTAISQSSELVLRQIEVTIKNYEREKIAERSESHERTDLHPQRGLSDSRSMLMKQSSARTARGCSATPPQSKFSPRCRNVWSITGRW